MSNCNKWRALAAALSLISSITLGHAETADAVLFNGKILTVDADFSVREALADFGRAHPLQSAHRRQQLGRSTP